MASANKQLNEMFTAYYQLLILIECSIARFIACDSTRRAAIAVVYEIHAKNSGRIPAQKQNLT